MGIHDRLLAIVATGTAVHHGVAVRLVFTPLERVAIKDVGLVNGTVFAVIRAHATPDDLRWCFDPMLCGNIFPDLGHNETEEHAEPEQSEHDANHGRYG